MDKKVNISVFSSADKVKGQGVGSAYLEQVGLVKNKLLDKYDLHINKMKFSEINHYHTVDFIYYLTLPLARLKGKTVGYVHFLPETMDNSLKLPKIAKYIFYKYLIAFYKSMDTLVTVNPYFIDALAEYGVNKDTVTYIPNFVSDSKFFPLRSEEQKNIKKKYNISEDTFTVLSVGQLQTRKGVADFVEVAKRLPNVQFVWAGGFSFGRVTDGYNDIKKIINNPPKNVKFLGIVDRSEMNDIYNMTDLLFMPSYAELFPMTILEAMNCSKPVLLRDIDIYENILFDFYIKGNNNDDFVNIINLLSYNKEYYENAVIASKKGHDYYSESTVANTWDDFYSGLLKVEESKIIDKRGNLENEKQKT